MNRITIHLRDGKPDIVTMPPSVEVEIIDFDANDGLGQRLRFFVYDHDIMEEVLDPPNIVEGKTK